MVTYKFNPFDNFNIITQNVETYANLASFPATGKSNVLYIDEATNISYYWTGAVYTAISSGGGSFDVDLDSAESTVTRVFAGGRTTFTVTHSLGTLDVKPEVFRLSDGRTINWRIERTGINTIEASRNGNVADGLFRLII